MFNTSMPLESAQVEKLGELMKAYWYDREEDDIEIIFDVVDGTSRDHLTECLEIARQFADLLSSEDAYQTLLRRWVWHRLPTEHTELAIWMSEVLEIFKEANSGTDELTTRKYAEKKVLSTLFLKERT